MKDHYGEMRHLISSTCDRVSKETCLYRTSCRECETLELYKIGYRNATDILNDLEVLKAEWGKTFTAEGIQFAIDIVKKHLEGIL